MPKPLWKPHKSKDLTFLHGNYTQLFFSTPKNIFFGETKKIFLGMLSIERCKVVLHLWILKIALKWFKWHKLKWQLTQTSILAISSIILDPPSINVPRLPMLMPKVTSMNGGDLTILPFWYPNMFVIWQSSLSYLTNHCKLWGSHWHTFCIFIIWRSWG